MRTLLLGFLLISTSLLAQPMNEAQGISLRNDREGQSSYISEINKLKLKQFAKKLPKEEVVKIYREALALQQDKKLCSYELTEKMKETLLSLGLEKLDLDTFILTLRQENEIDDVVAKILMKTHKVQSTKPLDKPDEYISYPETNEKNEELLKIVASFEKRFLKSACFDEAYRAFHSELVKKEKHIKALQVEGLVFQARKDNRIDDKTFLMLMQGGLNDLEQGGLTLAAYHQKITMLRTQYPLRDREEKSKFVTEKIKKIKMSRRQLLYESYSDIQIIMMGNIVKTLRADLESPKMEILVYGKDAPEPTRKIELQPMERFRFAIKVLRKEMALMANNTYFGGRAPDYLDLMTASYELGIIPASELEEIAGLQEIWNPKKTFWDKASVWVSTFAGIATLVIPPPYGFIPALAVVVIQATTQNKKKGQNVEDPTILF